MGSEYRLPPRAAPDVVLDGAVAKLERAILLLDGVIHPDFGMTLRAVMVSVAIESQRIRDEGWAPRA